MVRLYRIIKRIVDFCFALLILIVLSPLILLLIMGIFITSGPPIVYHAERIGKGKRIFIAYKFRTLVEGIKRKKHGLSENIVSSKLAGFMRDTHLDEILQLFNILYGDMSFIGPRPLDVPRYHHVRAKNTGWDNIFKIRPGLTCLNQIARYSDNGLNKVRKLEGLNRMKRRNRLLLDRYYIKNESLILDLKITLWTIEYIIGGFFSKLFRKGEYSFL